MNDVSRKITFTEHAALAGLSFAMVTIPDGRTRRVGIKNETTISEFADYCLKWGWEIEEINVYVQPRDEKITDAPLTNQR